MPGNEQHTSKISSSPSLTDILIEVEDFFDSLDLYVFKNWFDGEIVDGPVVSRYKVSITLQWEYKDMPDPMGGMRLVGRGCKVYFKKIRKEVARDIQSPSDYRPGKKGKPAMDIKEFWLVEIQVPRRFIDDIDATDLELAADSDIDEENVTQAHDEDINTEDAFTSDAGDDGGDDADSEDESSGGDDGDSGDDESDGE